MPLALRPHVLIAVLALAIVASSVAAAVVDSDGVRTVLGLVAGASTPLLLGALLVSYLTARAQRRNADLRTLDALDPLGAAQRDTL